MMPTRIALSIGEECAQIASLEFVFVYGDAYVHRAMLSAHVHTITVHAQPRLCESFLEG